MSGRSKIPNKVNYTTTNIPKRKKDFQFHVRYVRIITVQTTDSVGISISVAAI